MSDKRRFSTAGTAGKYEDRNFIATIPPTWPSRWLHLHGGEGPHLLKCQEFGLLYNHRWTVKTVTPPGRGAKSKPHIKENDKGRRS